jgi:predicted O-methyltransferase YrrM
VTEIAGWLDPEVAAAMRQLIKETQPNVCVEIGVYAGKSLINSAIQLNENGNGVIYGIDPWRTKTAVNDMAPTENVSFWANTDLDDVHAACMHAIWEHEVENQVIIIRATSQVAAQMFSFYRRDEIDVIDILYIDGGHSEAASCLDVKLYLPLVLKGGYIWIDDTDYPSLQKALSILREYCTLIKEFGRVHLYQKTTDIYETLV